MAPTLAEREWNRRVSRRLEVSCQTSTETVERGVQAVSTSSSVAVQVPRRPTLGRSYQLQDFASTVCWEVRIHPELSPASNGGDHPRSTNHMPRVLRSCRVADCCRQSWAQSGAGPSSSSAAVVGCWARTFWASTSSTGGTGVCRRPLYPRR